MLYLLLDLLEKGLTTGQASRLMFTPFRRKSPEEEENAEETGSQVKDQPEGEPEEKENETAEGEGQVQPEEKLEMKRGWFNMVCYGLPNLIVTQLSKP